MERDEDQAATIMITGAGGGIGSGIARALYERGDRIICSDYRYEPAVVLCEELGGKARPLQMDVTTQASVDGAMAQLPEDFQSIDVLINCAGHDVGGRRPFHEGTARQLVSILETNLVGLVRVTHAFIGGMIERGRGHIISLGSVAGLRTYPGGSAYVTSKAGVHAFMESLRADYQDTDLRFTELLPGPVATEFHTRRFLENTGKGQAYTDSLPGLLAVEDVVRATLFALSAPMGTNVAQVVIAPTREVF